MLPSRTGASVACVGILAVLTSSCDSLARSSESPQGETSESSRLSRLPNLNGRLVFQSDVSGDWDIYLLELSEDETPTETRLTRDQSNDLHPSFSPDGETIVFASERSGAGDLYLMDRRGESLRQLTDHPAYEGAPQFSPDGQWVLFEAERDGSSEIYRVSIDGSKVNRLTDSTTRKLAPTMAPDGKHFAYMEKSWIRWHVSLQNWDSGEVTVVSGGGGACRPIFSSDGRWLGYVGTEQADKTDIWVYEMPKAGDSGSRWRVTTRPNAHNYDPSFDADARYLAFSSTRSRGRDEQWDLFIADTNGRSLSRLTESEANERFPTWSPFMSREEE